MKLCNWAEWAGNMGRASRWLVGLVCLLGWVAGAQEQGQRRVQVKSVRWWSLGDVTRIAVEVSGDFTFRQERLSSPERVYFDILNAINRVGGRKIVENFSIHDGVVRQLRVGQNRIDVVRVVIELEGDCEVSASRLANPERLVVEVRARGRRERAKAQVSAAIQPSSSGPLKEGPAAGVAETAAGERVSPSAPIERPQEAPLETAGAVTRSQTATPPVAPVEQVPQPARRTREGEQSLTRALGLKVRRIVIDPGHGGKDTGTIGPTGLQEKDLTLDVAQRLAQLVSDRLGAEVVLTRSADEFVPLERRTEIANNARADLFVSLHVNSSRYRSVNGIETFYLDLTDSEADLEVAARENAGSTRSVHELSELIRKIALSDKLKESREFAGAVQQALYRVVRQVNGQSRNRGVKKAPFVVLIGAEMPSILVELGFITNPQEERLLKNPAYRQRLAEAIFQGIEVYAKSLSHFRTAATTGDE